MHNLTQLLIEAEHAAGGGGAHASIDLTRSIRNHAPTISVNVHFAHITHSDRGTWGEPGIYVSTNNTTRNVHVFTDDPTADPADLLRELIEFLRSSPIREEVVL